MKTKAKRTDWKNSPISKPKMIDIEMKFSLTQLAELKKGLIPEQMEDKWFIFYERGWLYFHRSWTGDGMYKAKLIKEGEGYSIKEFLAERDKEIYGNVDDNEDRENFVFLIVQGLLKMDTCFQIF